MGRLPAVVGIVLACVVLGAAVGDASASGSVVASARTTVSIRLTVDPSPAVAGQTAVWWVQISQPVNDGTVLLTLWPPGAAAPSGPLLRECVPQAGRCPVSLPVNLAGAWSVVADWSGDGLFAPAASAPASLRVSAAPDAGAAAVDLRLAIAPDPLTASGTALLTATVAGAAQGGTVGFSGTGPAGAALPAAACAPDRGRCAVRVQLGAAGVWTIEARWTGLAGGRPAAAGDAVQVRAAPASGADLDLAASPLPGEVGQPVALTVLVDRAADGGGVRFYAAAPGGDELTLGGCVVSEGSCGVVFTPARPGTYGVWAVWSGEPGSPSRVAALDVPVRGAGAPPAG